MAGRQPERRVNPWFDPRFFVQILIMAVGVYVAVQVRTDRLEQSADGLKNQAAKIEGQLQQIVSSVSSLTNTAVALSKDMEARGREIDELKRSRDMQDARIISLEKVIAKYDGLQQGRR